VNNWQETSLGEVADFENGKAHEQCIHDDGDYIVVNSKFIASEGKEYKRSNKNLSPLEKDTIVMVMSDIPNGKALAKCFFIDQTGKYTLNQRICSLKSKEGVDSRFLYYVLNRHSYYLQFDSGVGQTNLRKDEVLDCPVPLPPLPEQKRIAEILGTWDRGIDVVRLIRYKYSQYLKNIRKKIFFYDRTYAVQRLGDLVVLNYGKSPKEIVSDDGKYPIIGTGGSSGKAKAPLCRSAGVVIGRKGTIDKPQFLTQPFWAIDTTYYVEESPNYDLLWIYHLFYSLNLKQYNESSGVPSLNRETIYDLDVHVPDIKIQKSIGLMLDEIEQSTILIKTLTEKLQNQKQGLMQKLLTGKIRVKV